MFGIVDRVDEDPPPPGSLTDLPVDRWRRCGDDPPRGVEIGIDELPPHNLNIRVLDVSMDARSDHSDPRSRGNQPLDLGCGDETAPYHDDSAAGQIEERGKHDAHTDAGTFRRDP